MKYTFLNRCIESCIRLRQTTKAKLFLCSLHLKRVNLITLLLLTASLLLADIQVETRYVAAQSQPDCGSAEGIKLPCWTDFRDSGEGEESLPLYPYAKRPNGCSIPGSSPGSNDSVNIAGINISFTDICNKHDRCYYTTSTTASECNVPFQSELRARCEHEIADHAINGWDIFTGGTSRATVLGICVAKADTMATAVIGVQEIYHKEAHVLQEKYEDKVAEYVEEMKCSPPGPMSIVYVDTASTKTCERGNEQMPYRAIKSGSDNVVAGGSITIQAGSYKEKLYINRPMTLVASGGIVTINGTNASVAAAASLSSSDTLPLTQDAPPTITTQTTEPSTAMSVYLPLLSNQPSSGVVDLAAVTVTNDATLVDTLSNIVDLTTSTTFTLAEASNTGQVIYLPLIAQ